MPTHIQEKPSASYAMASCRLTYLSVRWDPSRDIWRTILIALDMSSDMVKQSRVALLAISEDVGLRRSLSCLYGGTADLWLLARSQRTQATGDTSGMTECGVRFAGASHTPLGVSSYKLMLNATYTQSDPTKHFTCYL